MSTLLERELYAWGRVAWDRLPSRVRERAIPLAQQGYRMQLSLAAAIHGGTPGAPVLVAATMRSGSNLLSDLLDAHPELRMLGEGLNPLTRYGMGRVTGNPELALEHLRWLFARCPNVRPAAKLLADQLALHQLSVADVARAFPEARWIVLYRRSLTSQFLSLLRARATGKFIAVRSRTQHSNGKVAINRDELKLFCQEMRETYRQIMSQLAAHEPLVLQYELLARDPQGVFDREVWHSLRLDKVAVATHLNPQSSVPLSEALSNFDAVRELVEGPEAQLEIDPASGSVR